MSAMRMEVSAVRTGAGARETPPVEPIAVTVAQAAALIGVKRTKAYDMIRRGELPVVRVGTITRVPLAALRELFSLSTPQ